MNTVTVVRIYVSEHKHHLAEIIDYLYQQATIKGLTVFRGVEGFGDKHQMHTAHLIEASMDLPMVIEFFDAPDKVNAVLPKLSPLVKPGHIISWSATVFP